MTYSLERHGDHAGDAGKMSKTFLTDGKGKFLRDKDGNVLEGDGTPVLGAIVQVGSFYARTYEPQDWWMTTPVQEIISDEIIEDGDLGSVRKIVFRTLHSVYTWRQWG